MTGSRPRLPRLAVRALPAVLVAGGVAAALGACGATNPAAPTTAPVTEAPEPTTVVTVADTRAAWLAGVLGDAGFPPVVRPQTLFALADGVCRQTTDGTPDSVILAHLAPTASYAASQSGGVLTADRAAQLLLDSSRSDFC